MEKTVGFTRCSLIWCVWGGGKERYWDFLGFVMHSDLYCDSSNASSRLLALIISEAVLDLLVGRLSTYVNQRGLDDEFGGPPVALEKCVQVTNTDCVVVSGEMFSNNGIIIDALQLPCASDCLLLIGIGIGKHFDYRLFK